MGRKIAKDNESQKGKLKISLEVIIAEQLGKDFNQLSVITCRQESKQEISMRMVLDAELAAALISFYFFFLF